METEKLIGLIESVAKEGTDLSPIKEAVGSINPLSGLKDKNDAWGFIKQNDLLLSTLDQKVTERVKTAEENLMSGKVADLIKARESELRAELNPTESESDKRLRELTNQIADRDKKEQFREFQDTVSEKAKEIDFFDPMLARKLAVVGEDAIGLMEEINQKFKTELENRVNTQVKEKYATGAPKTGVIGSDYTTMNDSQLTSLAHSSPELKGAILEEVKRRTRK